MWTMEAQFGNMYRSDARRPSIETRLKPQESRCPYEKASNIGEDSEQGSTMGTFL